MGSTIGEAIVVRVVDYGEADRIATLLLRAEGKVSALAKGARRSRKRYGGLELFALGQATLREGRGELWALEAFDIARGFPHLALDVARVAQAAYACELTRELMPAHHGEPRAYDLLRLLLERIDAGQCHGALGPAHLRVFELALLDAMGLGPALDRCVSCGDEVSPAEPDSPVSPAQRDSAVSPTPPADPGRHFDVRRGGLLCERCGHGQAPGERPLPESARRLLLAAQQLPLAEAARLADAALPREAWDAARDTLQALLREHLGRPLRSVEFIAKLNAAGA